MSSVKSKKLPRNDQSMLNYDIKKRTTEDKSFPKKDVEKRFKRKMRSKGRKSTGKRKKIFSKNISVKNIH